jgi:hypothetical protein
MSEENSSPVPGGESASQRQPTLQQAAEAFQYMRESTRIEVKRGTDKANAAVLPVACILLIVAISITATPALKALSFLAPMAAFSYYVAARVGIVRTMNSRQAYLTFHMLIATLLLGGTMALFFLFVLTLMFKALK